MRLSMVFIFRSVNFFWHVEVIQELLLLDGKYRVTVNPNYDPKTCSSNHPVLASEKPVHGGPLLVPLLCFPHKVHINFPQSLLDIFLINLHL